MQQHRRQDALQVMGDNGVDAPLGVQQLLKVEVGERSWGVGPGVHKPTAVCVAATQGMRSCSISREEMMSLLAGYQIDHHDGKQQGCHCRCE